MFRSIFECRFGQNRITMAGQIRNRSGRSEESFAQFIGQALPEILIGDGRACKVTATGYTLAGQVGWSHPGAYSNGSPLMDESLPIGYSPNRESHHGECW